MSLSARLSACISAHAWNADCSSLALSPNSSEVWIYTNCHAADSAAWERSFVLRKHDGIVSAIDWHPVTNKIVTCSHDRSAFVWVLKGGEWEPQVAILPHRMACLDVKWSPDGKKFAVASGSKKALIAFYEATNDWWVAKEARKHKSTVLSLAWHPSSQVLATVACDYTCRVTSAFVEGLDAAPAATPFGALPEAGETLQEFEITRAWVNDVAWSPSGKALAFVGHDSLLHLVSFAGEAPTLQTIKCPTLPANRVMFLAESALVTVGHSMNPELYVCSSSSSSTSGGGAGAAAVPIWTFYSYLDKRPDASASAKATGGVAAARAMFSNKASKGTGGGGDTEVWTKHQSAIVGIKPYSKQACECAPSSATFTHTLLVFCSAFRPISLKTSTHTHTRLAHARSIHW